MKGLLVEFADVQGRLGEEGKACGVSSPMAAYRGCRRRNYIQSQRHTGPATSCKRGSVHLEAGRETGMAKWQTT